MEVDLQRKRIALTMRLDEQPGETGARRGGGNSAANGRDAARPAKTSTKRPAASSAGNSAMGDALAAAFGKKS